MRRWWARRAGWHQAAIVLGIIAVLTVIAAAVGCGAGGESAEKPTTSARAVAPVLIAPAGRPAPPAGTGRMSVREWESATSALAGVNREVDHYTEELAGRCSVLLRAVEVAKSLACFNDAYAGVEDRVVISVYQLDAFQPHVGRSCATALRYAGNILNGSLFRALRASRKALASLNSLVIKPSAAVRLQRHRLDHASAAMTQLCAPA